MITTKRIKLMYKNKLVHPSNNLNTWQLNFYLLVDQLFNITNSSDAWYKFHRSHTNSAFLLNFHTNLF